MKKLLSLLVAAVLICGLCTAALADETVNLRLAYWGGVGEKQNMESTVKKFMEAYPNVKVELMHIPNDFQTKMQTMIASGTEPDLAYGNIMSYSWAKEDKVWNVYDFMADDPTYQKDDMFDFAWYEWETGKSFGGFIANGFQTMMYNKKLFDEAGIAYPPVDEEEAWTWDEMLEVAKRLTLDTKGRDANDPEFDAKHIKQYGLSFPYWWAGWLTMVRSNGGDIVTEDGKGFGLTSPEAIDALQKMADLIHVHHVCPEVTTSLPNVATRLQSGMVAMAIDGTWSMADLALIPNFEWGVGVLPKMQELKYIITSGTLCIMKSTEHPKEAWELYKWVMDPEQAIDLHRGLWLPAMPKWYTEPELIEKWASPTLPGRPEGFQQACMTTPLACNTYDPETQIINFDQIEALVSPALQSVWLGDKTAEQAVREIEPKVLPLIEGFYSR